MPRSWEAILDRIIGSSYNDGTSYHYVYDGESNLARQYETDADGDLVNGFDFEYDLMGRLVRSFEWDENENIVLQTHHVYDTANRLTSQQWKYSDEDVFSESYTYRTNDALLGSMQTSAGSTIQFSYDALKRLSSETVTQANGSALFTEQLEYRDSTSTTNRTTTQVSEQEYVRNNAVVLGRSYTYQGPGNIKNVTDTVSGNLMAAYTYDGQNQLATETIYENGDGTVYTYSYDTAGNLLSVQEDGVTVHTYAYDDDHWADLLTAFDTHTIEYDAIGNPTSYYNGLDYEMTWVKGRRLATVNTGGTLTSYTYDMDGIRSSKTVGSTVYEYETLNGTVMRQTGNGYTLDFVYDAHGSPHALIYTVGGTSATYYYLLNLQGDVIALMDYTGSIIARYEYNAWGEIRSITDANGGDLTTNASHIAIKNPLRYRGYYYDAETGFYYLQSRYYDPEIKRFINADSQFSSDLTGGMNFFVYCGNNPVFRVDSTGNSYIGSAFKLLFTWLKGVGEDQVYSNNDILTKSVKTSKKMQGIINDAISIYKSTGQSTYSGWVEFTSSEDGWNLYLAAQHCNYAITVTEEIKETGFWFFKNKKRRYVASVIVYDTYDFNGIRDWRGLGNILNNGAFLAHEYLNIGADYAWEVNYVYYGDWENVN